MATNNRIKSALYYLVLITSQINASTPHVRKRHMFEDMVTFRLTKGVSWMIRRPLLRNKYTGKNVDKFVSPWANYYVVCGSAVMQL